uniref:DUF5641 domain-containing protein n=1 Tax=Panagrellus redivivus TaxID=6233 RepID=A0A7E4ZTE9_PANRE
MHLAGNPVFQGAALWMSKVKKGRWSRDSLSYHPQVAIVDTVDEPAPTELQKNVQTDAVTRTMLLHGGVQRTNDDVFIIKQTCSRRQIVVRIPESKIERTNEWQKRPWGKMNKINILLRSRSGRMGK